MSIQIKEINDLKELNKLKEEWNDFVRLEKPNEWLFYSCEWFLTWWDTFAKKGKLVVLLIYSREKLVGIAPLYLKKTFYLGIYVYLLELMGNEHTSRNLIIIKNNDKCILKKLMDYLINNYSKTFICLRDIYKEEPIYKHIINYCKDKPLDYKERVMRISPVITLDKTWEDYFKTRTTNFKREIRKKEKKIKQLRDVKITHYQDLGSLDECFDKIKKIATHSWQSKQKTSFGVDKNLFRCYYQLAALATKYEFLDISILKLDGESVAYLFNININKIVYACKKEFDGRYNQYSFGFYLDIEMIKEAYREKYKLIDLQGYKTDDKDRFATSYHEYWDVYIYTGIKTKLIKVIDFNVRAMVKNILRYLKMSVK